MEKFFDAPPLYCKSVPGGKTAEPLAGGFYAKNGRCLNKNPDSAPLGGLKGLKKFFEGARLGDAGVNEKNPCFNRPAGRRNRLNEFREIFPVPKKKGFQIKIPFGSGLKDL
jgi:hypothetical protein